MRWIGLVLFAPVFVFAAHCFIWDYPEPDSIYDSEAGTTIDDTYWLRQALTALGHTYVMNTTLPSDITPYAVIFAMCGWYDC